MGQLVFPKKQYISAGCIQTIIGIVRIPPFKSNRGTTKWNESTPGHCIPLHHVIASPNLQGDQAKSLRPVPSSSVFCREFMSMRIKCLMAPTLFSLAAFRMSRPRIPFKSKIFCKRSDKSCIDMFGELKGTNSRIGRNMQKIQKYSKMTRRNPSVRGGEKSRLLDTCCMEKPWHFVFRLSLKNGFRARLLQNMQAQKLKLHQFCETSSKNANSRFVRQSRQLLPLLLLLLATGYWLLQTGYMLPLLGELLQLAPGYCYCYLLLLLLLAVCKAGQKFVYPKFSN